LACFGFYLSDLFGFARRRTVEIHVSILERAEQSSSSEDHLHGAVSYGQEVGCTFITYDGADHHAYKLCDCAVVDSIFAFLILLSKGVFADFYIACRWDYRFHFMHATCR
jgi:hypothetical protein